MAFLHSARRCLRGVEYSFPRHEQSGHCRFRWLCLIKTKKVTSFGQQLDFLGKLGVPHPRFVRVVRCSARSSRRAGCLSRIVNSPQVLPCISTTPSLSYGSRFSSSAFLLLLAWECNFPEDLPFRPVWLLRRTTPLVPVTSQVSAGLFLLRVDTLNRASRLHFAYNLNETGPHYIAIRSAYDLPSPYPLYLCRVT
jgi:hypothetical protein